MYKSQHALENAILCTISELALTQKHELNTLVLYIIPVPARITPAMHSEQDARIGVKSSGERIHTLC